MKKFLAIILIVSGFWAVASAVEPETAFTALYWVKGSLIAPGEAGGLPVDPAHPLVGGKDGRQVVFYEMIDTGNMASDTSGPTGLSALTGQYLINIYQDRGLDIRTDRRYFVAVARGTDNFGADPVEVNIRGGGWEDVNLALGYGRGPVTDSGRIRNTWIERAGDAVGSSVWVHWGFDTLGPTNVNIYTSDNLMADPATWTLWQSNIAGDLDGTSGRKKEYTNIVGRTPNTLFFRVVPNPVLGTGIFDPANNTINVCKQDISVKQLFNMITVPMITTAPPVPPDTNPINLSINSAIGGQLTDGAQLIMYDPARTNPTVTADKSSGAWGDPFMLIPGTGYWLYRPPRDTEDANVNVTFVGRVMNNVASLEISALWNLKGYPYPTTIANLDGASFNSVTSDQVLEYIYDTTLRDWTYHTSTKGAATWDEVISLTPGKGFWYYRMSSGGVMNWNPPVPR